MSEKVSILDNKTLIPIGALVVVFGASMWLTSVYNQGQANANEINQLKEQTDKDFSSIEKKLDRINDKLDRLLENQKLR